MAVGAPTVSGAPRVADCDPCCARDGLHAVHAEEGILRPSTSIAGDAAMDHRLDLCDRNDRAICALTKRRYSDCVPHRPCQLSSRCRGSSPTRKVRLKPDTTYGPSDESAISVVLTTPLRS